MIINEWFIITPLLIIVGLISLLICAYQRSDIDETETADNIKQNHSKKNNAHLLLQIKKKKLIKLGISHLGTMTSITTALIAVLGVAFSVNSTAFSNREAEMQSKFDAAIEHLTSDSMPSRITGVNTLVTLADEWGRTPDNKTNEYQQNACIYALQTYLKEPSPVCVVGC